MPAPEPFGGATAPVTPDAPVGPKICGEVHSAVAGTMYPPGKILFAAVASTAPVSGGTLNATSPSVLTVLLMLYERVIESITK